MGGITAPSLYATIRDVDATPMVMDTVEQNTSGSPLAVTVVMTIVAGAGRRTNTILQASIDAAFTSPVRLDAYDVASTIESIAYDLNGIVPPQWYYRALRASSDTGETSITSTQRYAP